MRVVRVAGRGASRDADRGEGDAAPRFLAPPRAVRCLVRWQEWPLAAMRWTVAGGEWDDVPAVRAM